MGHDWGAPVAWTAAMLRPDKVRAVAGLSIPPILPGGMVRPRSPAPSTARVSTRSTSSNRESPTPSSPRTSRTSSAASWSAPRATTRSAGSPARWSYPPAWASCTPCRSRPLSRPG
ncbi:hypothetical protein [Streptomyces sp. V4I8]|uniref:hypothetical protein n=1 Tax=Streptomyces sp. V4I8 TaxID=3156469 RepID=UPI0035196149